MLDALKWDRAGLVVVVAQDVFTGEARMVAFANREAVEATLRTMEAHFWSRSRQKLWRKGESSGNVLKVHEVWADCDGDALVYLVEPAGPTCHTGAESCFWRRLDASAPDGERALPVLATLTETIRARADSDEGSSYTKSLLTKGAPKIGAKLREEADELAVALADEADERVSNEAADVLYHAMVGLQLRGLSLRDVTAVLAKRFGVSGHDEKASRQK
ncbi:MAG: bifunctional phosphoribosyl-AMP cyclohydrolase/phosphoribosyl-ATP diphosphatase HisIE [Myxococcota bacterium]